MLSLRNTPAIALNASHFTTMAWRDQRNKQLMKLAIEHRLNLSPCTIFQLDQLGMNELQILHMGNCVGELNVKLSIVDGHFLDEMQEAFKIVFNYHEKLRKVTRYRINSFCSDFITDKRNPSGPMCAIRVVSLLTLEALK